MWKKILFLCSANVGRSQIAQWYYNHLSKWCFSQSAALVEDRINLRAISKDKNIEEINNRIISYWWKPDKSIIQIMKDDWIDISNQRIKLLNSLSYDEISSFDKIIILFNPVSIEANSYEFDIDWINPYQYLINNFKNKIGIFEIKDPFWQNISDLIDIRNEIKKLVINLMS